MLRSLIDILIYKYENRCCVLGNQQINLAKNGKVLITEHSQRNLKDKSLLLSLQGLCYWCLGV